MWSVRYYPFSDRICLRLASTPAIFLALGTWRAGGLLTSSYKPLRCFSHQVLSASVPRQTSLVGGDDITALMAELLNGNQPHVGKQEKH